MYELLLCIYKDVTGIFPSFINSLTPSFFLTPYIHLFLPLSSFSFLVIFCAVCYHTSLSATRLVFIAHFIPI